MQREAEARLAQAVERAQQKEAEREAQTEERRRQAQARQVHIAQARDRVREREAERVEGMLRKEVLAERRLEERRAREASKLERQKLVDEEYRAQRQLAVGRAKEASSARTRAMVLARSQREERLWHNMEVQTLVKKQQHVQSKLRQSDARERVKKVKEEVLLEQEKIAAKIQKKAEWVASLEHQKAQAYEELQLTKKKMRAEQDDFKREMQRTLDRELRRAKFASEEDEDAAAGSGPSSAPPQRPGSARAKPRTATGGRQRPGSAPTRREGPGQPKKGSPLGITFLPDPVETSLRQVIEEERAKEAERAEVLTKVHDPKERQRLHKLFNIEREHAKEIIVRLSAQLS